MLIKKEHEELKDKIENKDQEFIYDDGDENKENIDPDAGIYREVSGKLITKFYLCSDFNVVQYQIYILILSILC